jgi:tRNA(Ile)-lysidine synthase
VEQGETIEHRVESRVARAAIEGGMIPPRASVILAVSGGMDSVVLLDVLHRLAGRDRAGWRLTVAHLDHGLRGDSAEDARFVEELAARCGLECVSQRCDVAEIAGHKGMGIEEAARVQRLSFLRQVARSRSAGVVAMGHHADDQVETVLFRLFRGAHLRGLAGMAARRDVGDGVRLVRPMLGLRRAEIREYATGRGLDWHEDATNADTVITRNWIRHELLPALRERLNPQVDEAVLRAAGAAGEADDLLGRLGEELVAVEADGMVSVALAGPDGLHAAVVARAVRMAVERSGAPMDRVGTEWVRRLTEMAEAGRGVCDLPGELRAWVEDGSLRIGPAGEWDRPTPFEVDLRVGETVRLPGGITAAAGVRDVDTDDVQELLQRARALPDGLELLDADAVRGAMTVRPRKDGDRFAPLGMDGSQTVSDLLSGAGVPPRRRQRALCVCDEEGIIYVWPIRIAQRVALGPDTRRCLRVEIGPVEEF